MSKHTAGPWDYDAYNRTIVPQGKLSPAFRENLKVAAICKIKNRESGTDHYNEERDANAHLIAAAPELLDALNDAMGLTHCLDGYYMGNEVDAIVKKMQAAIIKAEGKS